MTQLRRCPRCDSEIPADAPQGLCPKCLLQVGMASEADQSAQSSIAGKSAMPPESPPTAATPTGSFVPPSVEDLAQRFPQLEILELIGRGGMGAVYKARQPGLDRLVALKVLPPEVGRDPAFAERFQREARSLARLNHPHIVAVYDFGQSGDVYYFVMEFVEGATLRQVIAGGELTAEEALGIVPQICDALQYAHDEGIVHRDIKPENVLLDRKGRVKIADFGLAKLLRLDVGEQALTLTQQVMGTPHYMAPEQLRGTHAVDHRADIYSLGVVFYELLTGELPLGRFAPPSKKVEIDVRLDEVVLRALEREPQQRYQRASDVKTDIESIEIESIEAKTGSRGARRLPAAEGAPAIGVASREATFAPDQAGHAVSGSRWGWWRLARAVTLLAALVGGIVTAAPWQSVEMRAPFTDGAIIQWFLSPGLDSVLGITVSLLFLSVFVVTLSTFYRRKATVPAATLVVGFLALGLMFYYLYHPPLADRTEVADVVSKLEALNPQLQVDGRPHLEIVREAHRLGLLDYWQRFAPAFSLTFAMAFLVMIAATVDLIHVQSGAAAVSDQVDFPKEPDHHPNDVDDTGSSKAAAGMRNPAAGLVLAGAATILLSLGAAGWMGIRVVRIQSTPTEDKVVKEGSATYTYHPSPERPMLPLYWSILVLQVLGVAAGGLMILGGATMPRLQFHGLAVLASILAMAPLSPAWPISVGLGYVALLWLRLPRVYAAFDQVAAGNSEPPSAATSLVLGFTKLSWVTLGCAAAGILGGFLPWVYESFFGIQITAVGVDLWYGWLSTGLMAAAALGVLAMCLFQRPRLWCGLVALLAGIGVLATVGSFFQVLRRGPEISASQTSVSGDLGLASDGLVDSLRNLATSWIGGSMSAQPGAGLPLTAVCGAVLLVLGLWQLVSARRRSIAIASSGPT